MSPVELRLKDLIVEWDKLSAVPLQRTPQPGGRAATGHSEDSDLSSEDGEESGRRAAVPFVKVANETGDMNGCFTCYLTKLSASETVSSFLDFSSFLRHISGVILSSVLLGDWLFKDHVYFFVCPHRGPAVQAPPLLSRAVPVT